MGVVNVTPDSFSDGGLFLAPDAAIMHGRALAAAGAAVLDVGGESTRPGADPVDADEETRRVLPVVRALVAEGTARVSIDTTKAAVARAALDAGATIVNDVSAGTADPEMLATIAEYRAGFVAMHMQGTPRTMQHDPVYTDVVREVGEYLRARVDAAIAVGIARDGILVDPGIGFGKTLAHNVALLRALPRVAAHAGAPLLVGRVTEVVPRDVARWAPGRRARRSDARGDRLVLRAGRRHGARARCRRLGARRGPARRAGTCHPRRNDGGMSSQAQTGGPGRETRPRGVRGPEAVAA